MTAAKIDWNEHNVEILRNMWSDGAKVSAIAFAITGSERPRNSILGKAHRLKLGPHANATSGKPRTKAIRKATKPTSKRTRKPKPAVAHIAPRPLTGEPMPADTRYITRSKAWEPLTGTTPVALESLERGQCRWPINVEKPFMFCAAPSIAGKCYCADHYRLSRPS